MASRAAVVVDEAADEETRGREVRRLRGEILRLEEEKRDLERSLSWRRASALSAPRFRLLASANPREDASSTASWCR